LKTSLFNARIRYMRRANSLRQADIGQTWKGQGIRRDFAEGTWADGFVASADIAYCRGRGMKRFA